MDYSYAIEVFERLNEDDKAKEIYAHFGRAVYYAQVLEQAAINMIAINKMINQKPKTKKEVEEIWNKYDWGKQTFGTLVNELKKMYSFSVEDIKNIEDIVTKRNFIAHDYFRFNIELFYNNEGQKRMIRDFVEFCILAQKVDLVFKVYIDSYLKKLGLTNEFIDKEMQAMKDQAFNILPDEDYITFIKR